MGLFVGTGALLVGKCFVCLNISTLRLLFWLKWAGKQERFYNPILKKTNMFLYQIQNNLLFL